MTNTVAGSSSAGPMRRDQERPIGGLPVITLLAAVVLAVSQPALSWADETAHLGANEGIAIGGSVKKSTITNTVYQENPATLAMLAKTLSDKDASEEKRREAEAKAEEFATKWRFTSAAVVGVFKILGEQDVPEEKVPARLIEIATHFVQTRDALAALEPDDLHSAELARQAKEAFGAGRLAEADKLLDLAKDSERAAPREARASLQRAQEAVNQHALNLAQIESSQGDIALTQLHYTDAAKHYEVAAAQLPSRASDKNAFFLVQAGDALQTSGNLAAALTDYQASHDIFERLAKADPGNASWQYDLAVSHNRIGGVQLAQGDLAAALTSYQASLAIIERLAQSAGAGDEEPAPNAQPATLVLASPPEPVIASPSESPSPVPSPSTAAVPVLPSVPPSAPTLPAAPAAVVPALMPRSTLSPEMVAALISRGDAMIAVGDIVAARLLYERAASTSVAAAVLTGRTYDPTYLAQIGARGMRPDPEEAAKWYARASDLGDKDGDVLLRHLRPPSGAQ